MLSNPDSFRNSSGKAVMSPFGACRVSAGFDHVKYGFRDIGGVVADPLDVLGTEIRWMQKLMLRGSSIM